MSAIIAGQNNQNNPAKTFSLCLTYTLSMSLTYGLYGYLASSFGLYFQAYLNSIPVMIILITFIIFLALTILSKHEIQLPHQFQELILRWSNNIKGGDYLAVIALGFLGSLIVSPCATAPFLGVISFIIKTGNVALGTVGFFGLGLGMSIPLLFINFINKMFIAKIEAWSPAINIGFGLALLIFAFYLINHLIPVEYSRIIWASLIIFISLHMGLLRKMQPNLFSQIWKTVCITVFIYAAVLLFGSFLTNPTLNPGGAIVLKETSSLPLPAFNKVGNPEDLYRLFSDAKLVKKPVLLDFHASWCSSCVDMDRNVWINPDVQLLLNRFVIARVDLSDIQSEGLSLAQQFNISGPPVILFFDEKGQLINLRLTGFISVEYLIKNLNHVLEKVGVE